MLCYICYVIYVILCYVTLLYVTLRYMLYMLYYVMLRYVILLLCFLYEHSSAVTTGLRFVTGSKFVCCRVWESRSVVQGTGLHLGVIETEA